jgi:hypothetical protein
MNDILRSWCYAAVLGRVIGKTIGEYRMVQAQRSQPCYMGPVPPVIPAPPPPPLLPTPTARKQLTDTDPFPFGKYRGRPVRDVPASYLTWLRSQHWLDDWPQVADYIRRKVSARG